MSKLRCMLALTLVACTPNSSTVGQRITCTVDPADGTILSCQPGEGDEADPNACEDVDEDGDGMPEDDGGDGAGDGTITRSVPSEACGCEDSDGDGTGDDDDTDDDDDGIDDDDDCDEEDGGDGDGDGDGDSTSAELPYDVKMPLGASFTPIVDAFAEKGPQPAAILSVEMDGGGSGWRLAELQSGATFTVTEADCTHAGNRDIGRDRVLVTWRNADGSSETDHLDLRYCEE